MSKRDNINDRLSNIDQILNYRSNMDNIIRSMDRLHYCISGISQLQRAMNQYNNISNINLISTSLRQYSNLSTIWNNSILSNSKYLETFSAFNRLYASQSNMFNNLSKIKSLQNPMANLSNISSAQKIFESHSRIFSAIEEFDTKELIDEEIEDKVNNIVDTFENENIDEQLNIIKNEQDFNTKISMLNTFLMVITLFAMILFGILAHNDSKINSENQDKIISLINKNIEIQEKQNELLKEDVHIKEQNIVLDEEQIKLIQELLHTTKSLEMKLSEKN